MLSHASLAETDAVGDAACFMFACLLDCILIRHDSPAALTQVCLQVSCLKCKASVGLDRRAQHACALTVDAAKRKLEEVLTEAGMLTCPNCTTSIVKSSGCNHMTCSKCRSHLCLLCCVVLAQADEHRDVYQHFAAGSPCWVFDNATAGHTENAAVQRMQITAANEYLATLDTAVALKVIQNSPLLQTFPPGSSMVSAHRE